jgi:hypothetical protein
MVTDTENLQFDELIKRVAAIPRNNSPLAPISVYFSAIIAGLTDAVSAVNGSSPVVGPTPSDFGPLLADIVVLMADTVTQYGYGGHVTPHLLQGAHNYEVLVLEGAEPAQADPAAFIMAIIGKVWDAWKYATHAHYTPQNVAFAIGAALAAVYELATRQGISLDCHVKSNLAALAGEKPAIKWV